MGLPINHPDDWWIVPLGFLIYTFSAPIPLFINHLTVVIFMEENG